MARLGGGTVILTNDIVYGDGGTEVSSATNYPTLVTHCDIQGGYAGTGNIDADPLFILAPGLGGVPDLHLRSGSPCLGAGTTTNAPTTTIDGKTRPVPPSLGAYERRVLSVPAQFATIQAAINAAQDGDIVQIANGTYFGLGNVDLDFGGKNITVASENGPSSVIIDCQGSPNANHRGFIVHSGETNAVIQGLTIENGYVDKYPDSLSGGGISVAAGSTARVVNCVITQSKASGLGGGVYSAGTLDLTGCFISLNTAAYNGGGICNSGKMVMTNCVLTRNTADNRGTGFYNSFSGTATLTNCTIANNSSTTRSGGGVAADSGGVTLVNDILYYDEGGEIGAGAATATNCDIQGGYAGTSNINAEPQFVFLSAFELHLSAGSPCLGAGTAAGAPLLTIDSETRPVPPSIGAYEATAYNGVQTKTLIQSSLNPSTYRQSVTFTAQVLQAASAAAPLQGTVVFTVDGTAQAPITLDRYQTAFYTSAILAIGPHTIAATYSGDANYAPSTPYSLTQDVGLGSTATAVVSSVNPSVAGQGVTFTAAVSGTSGTPSGSVIFTLDGTASAPVALTGGSAAFSTSSLTAGTHTLTAAYSGDGFNAPSMSAALTQTVTAAPAVSLINDTDSSLSYTGPGWGYYSGRGYGDYFDDVHATYANGSAVSYTFTGTSVGYVTETASDEGNVQVYLDGGLQATVSANSATRKVQQTLWSKTGLAAGSHTLRLVKASGGFLVLDALQLTAAPPPVSGTINDTDSAVSYSGGGWGYYPHRGLGDFSDDVHATYHNGDSATLSFTGTGISYVTETSPDEGKVSVYIDGALKQTVDCASATRAVQQTLYSVSGLSAEPHTITLVKQSGQFMLLDEFKFQ